MDLPLVKSTLKTFFIFYSLIFIKNLQKAWQ